MSAPMLGWCCLPQGHCGPDAGLALDSFVHFVTQEGFFLLATALVSPGDSSSNNHGFVLFLG